MPAGVPYTFSPGTTIASAQVNANFQALINYLNGLNIPTTPVSIANGGTGSATAVAALEALGLATGTIIPCSAAYSGTLIQLTGASTAPAVTAYKAGTTYVFLAPGSLSGPFTVQDVTTSGSGLAALPLNDSPGFSNTASLQANQLCLITYSAQSNSFVLINPVSSSSVAARFATFNASGTLTVPAGVTSMYATGCGGGGGGGASNGANFAGGSGGGGAAASMDVPITVTAGTVLTITVGASGAGAVSTAGTQGGTSAIVNSSSATLVSWTGGQGGVLASGTSDTTGAAAGGTGGISGGNGKFVTSSFGAGGFGGGCLLGGGGVGGAGDLPGQSPGQFGGGGGGGGSGTAGGAAGGNGAPGTVRLRW
jgi:hypothetical protein